MSASFEPRKKESAVDTVVNSIKKLILDKELKPGDKLPTEIEIATGLEVSRGSVREAMKILSAFGLIEVKVGSGTYISDRMNNKMADSFIFSFFATNPDMHQFVEFRKVMENDIMELILLHYDENEEERAELAQNVKELKSLKASPDSTTDDFAKNDTEFHKLLGKASKRNEKRRKNCYSYLSLRRRPAGKKIFPAFLQGRDLQRNRKGCNPSFCRRM